MVSNNFLNFFTYEFDLRLVEIWHFIILLWSFILKFFSNLCIRDFLICKWRWLQFHILSNSQRLLKNNQMLEFHIWGWFEKKNKAMRNAHLRLIWKNKGLRNGILSIKLNFKKANCINSLLNSFTLKLRLVKKYHIIIKYYSQIILKPLY